MFFIIHRGANEIGGNCVELETASGTRILLDAGLPLDYDEKTEEEKLTILNDARKWMSTADAIFISHAHADHYGLLSELDRDIPVFMSIETKTLLESNPFCRIDWSKMDIRTLPIRKPFTFKDLKITAYHVDHSAYGACSILLEADNKTVLYSGDIRLHGPKGRLYRLLPKHPDCLILEGTNIEGDDDCPKESALTSEFAEEFTAHPDCLHAVWCSGQNIDRIVTIYKACRKTGKTLIVDPYTAVILNNIAKLNPRIPHPAHFHALKIYFPQRLTKSLVNRDKTKYTLDLNPAQKKVTYDDIVSEPGKYVMLTRPSTKDFMQRLTDRKIRTRFTISNWRGYWEDPKTAHFRKFMEENCTLTPDIHTSGHADSKSIRIIIKHVSPSTVIPVHTPAAETCREKMGRDAKVLILDNEERHNL